MTTLDFTGRVAVVTGAGRGIGRAYALDLAARGARVVINDLGTAMAGGGRDASLAEGVVAEIVAAGGQARADTSDIADPEGAVALVEGTVEAYGRLDVLISNAGIFGMDSFPEADLETLQRFHAVHVGGALNTARAAWPHMSAAGYGRIVLTTSNSALGAADTIVYGTAKAGVLGLGRALARSGEPHGIRVNLVAPMAITRMMSSGMGLGEDPPEIPERDPSLVAPLVTVLCHESCPSTGEAYASGMRRYSRIVIADTIGYTHPDLDVTAEVLAEHWDDITDTADLAVVSDTMSWSARNREQLGAVPLP